MAGLRTCGHLHHEAFCRHWRSLAVADSALETNPGYNEMVAPTDGVVVPFESEIDQFHAACNPS